MSNKTDQGGPPLLQPGPIDDTLRLDPASETDARPLADIRLEAMRPSLEAVGRFDPDRARNRFLDTFLAADTWWIRTDIEDVGFLVLRERGDHLRLDHLYVCRTSQGGGIGRRVVRHLQQIAEAADLPITLTALAESPANGFYLAYDFACVGRDGVDLHYEWRPADQR